MSAARKGYRWTREEGAHAPRTVDSLSGDIWQGAPEWTHLIGRRCVFAPDLASLHDITWADTAGTTGTPAKRTAGNDSNVSFFGGHGTPTFATLNVTSAGAGTESILVINRRLVITTDAADNDLVCFCFNGGGGSSAILAALPFSPLAGTVIRCGFRGSISDGDQTDLLFGLTTSNVDPIGSTPDGIYIRKNDGDTQPDLIINGTSESAFAMTQDDGSTPIKVSNSTMFEAGFVINGVSSVYGYWNGHRTKATSMANLATGPFCPSFQIQNGEAANKVLVVEKFVITQDVI